MIMIQEQTELNIAKDFTPTPGPRKKTEGDFSGELFLEQLLRPRFQSAQASGNKLTINLDGAAGYPSSFLEAAFGGLAREFGPEQVDKTLVFICNDEPYLDEQIRKYIRDCNRIK